MGQTRRLGIIAATAPEASLVRRHLLLRRHGQESVGRYWSGCLYGQPVVVLQCGIGLQRATQATTWLARLEPLDGIMSFGYAGGLQTHLATGDAILATQVLSASATDPLGSTTNCRPYYPHAPWLPIARRAAAAANLTPHVGVLLSTSTMLTQARTKQRLGQLSGALAVDMESYAIAQVARQVDRPFVVLRTIFDTVAEDCALPPQVCTTFDGSLQPRPLLRYLGQHPRTLITLPRLWWQARRAGQQLQQWLYHFLRECRHS